MLLFILWDYNIIITIFRFFSICFCIIVSRYFSFAILRWIATKKRKKDRANDRKLLLRLSIFQYPTEAYFKFHVWKIVRVVVRSRYINTPTLICETSSMAKIAVINVNSQQNKFLVCIIVMQYNWTHFKHKTEKMGYEIKEVCTQFRSKSPVLINIQIRLNAQNIIQDQHLRFYA